MKKIALLILLVPGLAFATWPKQTQDQEQDQTQGQEQHQNQGQDQSQTQSMGDQNQANEQNVYFSSQQQVHSAIAPSISSSHPCVIGGSGALGLKGVNIGGGKQKVDPQCEIRETSRLLHSLGERELAVMLLCSTEAAQVGLSDQCAPSTTQAELRKRIEILLQEREHDREVCEESKDRIAEACKK